MDKEFYHGTDMRKGLRIFESGRLLSPWYKKVEELEKESEEYQKFMIERRGMTNLEEVALDQISGLYGEREIEHRVKSVSLTSDFDLAVTYARSTKGGCYGVVFGFSDGVLDCLEEKNRGTIQVPKFVDLEDSLKKIFWIDFGKGAESWYPDFYKAGKSRFGIEPKIVKGKNYLL